MKKTLSMVFLLAVALMLAACGSNTDSIADGNTEAANGDVDKDGDDMMVKADVDEDGDADVEVMVKDDEVVEVKIDMDEMQDDETKEAMQAAGSSEAFCTPGETYEYASEDGTVDSIIVGLTTYKGSEFCQAESTSVISTPVGDINSDTTYYFDSTFKEYWVTTTVSGGPAPATTTEVHIIDGEVQ